MLKVNLFFDESGKNDDAVKTMGSLMIPEKVYNCKEIVALNERLRKEEFELHWTKYNGGNSEAKIYKEIVDDAHREAEAIINRANIEIQREEEKVKYELKQQVVDISVMLSEKALGESIDESKHRELINDFIEKVGI